MRFSILIRHQRYFVLALVLVFLGVLFSLVPGDGAYWFSYWWMFPIAFIIALSVNTAGISGAALFVPFFILIFPLIAGVALNPIDTVKLGLITESFGLSSSALAFLSFGLVDTVLARRALLIALPFVFAGVLFVFVVPKAILYVAVAILLLLSVFLIKFEHTLKKKRLAEIESGHVDLSIANEERVVLTGANNITYTYCRTKTGGRKRALGYGVGGIFQGATGFGIGELGIISMMLTHIPMRIAIGTSHLIVAGGAIAASVVHFFLAVSLAPGVFPWNIPLMTVPAVIIGGQLAPYVAAKLPLRYLERFVSALFIIIAVSLLALAFTP